ncbi:unnamed protein product [Notodromas monacha]|uniref:Uncharacterized protein n=1 Tax=Notodromas monacha TaxID=399045 RepID=A0A7R9BY54_9CRUS|nr:unnamed protein product [Notodromas monacha]CAG0922816.1 unnamed protein product [Notodromas monacha]
MQPDIRTHYLSSFMVQEWRDYKFVWNPDEYGGVTELYVPSEHIWLPDIVVYNKLGKTVVEVVTTKRTVHLDFVYLQDESGNPLVDIGIDLREYYPSVEWDILSVPARRNVKKYPCCAEPYPDIYFNITLRRKTLFYTVNLIIPSVGLSYLSILVFYLPADSGEKVVLVISVLLSQTMFFLLISEIIPPTSLSVPLLGRYLLFTMFMVGASVLLTILVLNIHYRKPSTHRMAPWVRQFFIHMFPKAMCMNTPDELKEGSPRKKKKKKSKTGMGADKMHQHNHDSRLNNGRRRAQHQHADDLMMMHDIPPPPPPPGSRPPLHAATIDDPLDVFTSLDYQDLHRYPPQIERAVTNVRFIQHHLQTEDRLNSENLSRLLRYSGYRVIHVRFFVCDFQEDEDWAFVAMVLDRFFLYTFLLVSGIGTFGILLDAPSLYDYTPPIDVEISHVAQTLRSNELDF